MTYVQSFKSWFDEIGWKLLIIIITLILLVVLTWVWCHFFPEQCMPTNVTGL